MRETEELVAWGARLVAAALDAGQHRGEEWLASAGHFLGEVKTMQRRGELAQFQEQFDAGWKAGHSVRLDPSALLGDAAADQCVARILGATAGVCSNSAATSLDDEMEKFYALSASLLQALDEAGLIVRREAFEADQLLARRVKELESVLDSILRQFTHKGHPGYPATQTGWVMDRTVQAWRDVLAGTVRNSEDTTVLDKVPGEPDTERA